MIHFLLLVFDPFLKLGAFSSTEWFRESDSWRGGLFLIFADFESTEWLRERDFSTGGLFLIFAILESASTPVIDMTVIANKDVTKVAENFMIETNQRNDDKLRVLFVASEKLWDVNGLSFINLPFFYCMLQWSADDCCSRPMEGSVIHFTDSLGRDARSWLRWQSSSREAPFAWTGI